LEKKTMVPSIRRLLFPVLLPTLLLLLVASPSHAQPRIEGTPLEADWIAPGLDYCIDSLPWIDAHRLIRDGTDPADPWAGFEGLVGLGWKVAPDLAFGSPRWIIGPGMDTGIRPLTTEVAVQFSRELALRIAGALGIDDVRALVLDYTAVTLSPTGQKILGVDFKQTLAGFDVRSLREARRVRFVYNLDLGRLAALGSDWIPGLTAETAGAMSATAAAQRALEWIPPFAPGDGRVFDLDTYVLVGLDRASPARARLVHQARIQTFTPPHLWTVILDARTGDRIYVADHICRADVTGNVAIGTLDGAGGTPPTAPFSVKPAAALQVSVVGGGTAATDPQGNFRISNLGSTPVTVAGRYAGDWCTVVNQAGPNTAFSQAATPGNPVNIVMNGNHTTEFQTAEATAYHWVTRAHFFVKKRFTSFPGIAGLTTNVNMMNSCNAYFDGSSINFFRAGGQCNNMATPDVIPHEWGHAFHQAFGGPIQNQGFSEGIGDHLTLYLTDQRHIGRGISSNPAVGRDYRPGGGANNTQWPKTGSPSVHRDGEIWAGAMMDMRDNLVQKLGTVPGKDLSEILSIAPYSRRPVDMPAGVIGIMLQDDNDANLLNGTPHWAEITAAVDRHNLPRPPDPTIVQIEHTPLGTTRDVVNDPAVTARITSAAATIASASLTYRIGTASPITVNMPRGANDRFSAAIPAQPAVTKIAYSIRAVDTKNNVATSPRTGEHVFYFGREVVAIRDDFEQDGGWTPAPDDSATTGRFHRTDPFAAMFFQMFPAQPEDDHTPGAGTQCYVTQNGQRGQDADLHDVDGGKTTLVSPTLDLSRVPAGEAELSFAYWYTCFSPMACEPLTVGVSADGGKAWKDFLSISQTNPAWQTKSGLKIPGPYSSNMKIRFRIAEAPMSFSVTDVLIDDVEVKAIDDDIAALTAQTRTPSRGGTVLYTLEARRQPHGAFVFAASVTPGPIYVPGIGVMELGIPLVPIIPAAGLDASGRASIPIVIPNIPALRGVRLYTQALVTGSSIFFSNLWVLDIQ